MVGLRDIIIEVFEGNSITFECPISTTPTESLHINWLKRGNSIDVIYIILIMF